MRIGSTCRLRISLITRFKVGLPNFHTNRAIATETMTRNAVLVRMESTREAIDLSSNTT